MELIIPDLHIELTYSGKDRTEDVFDFLEGLYNKYASGQSEYGPINRITWLGDIFHSPEVSHSCIADFIKYLNKWTFTHHIILKGNHDGEEDSKKGSPLLEIEASGVAQIMWEPCLKGDGSLYLPYTSEDVLEKFRKNVLASKKAYISKVYSHLDIPQAMPGLEKEIARGSPCVFPPELLDYPTNPVIFSGHIHKPQQIGNLLILGSVLKCNVAERDEQKIYMHVLENGSIEKININTRNIQQFKLDFSKDCDKVTYEELSIGKHIEPTSIVCVEVTCPHTLAHLLNQVEFRDKVKSLCYHSRIDFNIVKERVHRMKDLDKSKSDYEVVDAFVTHQGVSDKEEIMKYTKGVMDEV